MSTEVVKDVVPDSSEVSYIFLCNSCECFDSRAAVNTKCLQHNVTWFRKQQFDDYVRFSVENLFESTKKAKNMCRVVLKLLTKITMS